MNKYSKKYVPGGLCIPKSLKKDLVFKSAENFQAPKKLILTGYCVPVDNQGQKPWCAAYAAANYAENLLWRKRGYHEEIDPAPLYRHAKSIDGNPDSDGTSLECALDALLAKGYFDRKTCKIRTIGGLMFCNASALNDIKYAIHRYGVCMGGFNITEEWYTPEKGVVKGLESKEEGGHAVLIVGYDEGGVVIQNSWGPNYAHEGFVYLTNSAFDKQFIYGALLTHTLDGLN